MSVQSPYSNLLMAHPFIVTTTSTFDRIAARTGTVTTAGTTQLGIYNGNGTNPTTRVIDAGAISYSASSTTYAITISVTLSPGVYWLAFNINSGSSTWQGYGPYNDRTMFQLMSDENSTSMLQTAFNASSASGCPADFGALQYTGWSAGAVFLRRSA